MSDDPIITQVKITPDSAGFGWIVWSKCEDLGRWWPEAFTLTKWGARRVARCMLTSHTRAEFMSAPSPREDA